MACAIFRIRGRVQGVSFRAATRACAQQLAISGYAMNLADGDVEVLACGGSSALDQLQAWLQHGPALARVESVQRFDAAEPATSLSGFAIR